MEYHITLDSESKLEPNQEITINDETCFNHCSNYNILTNELPCKTKNTSINDPVINVTINEEPTKSCNHTMCSHCLLYQQYSKFNCIHYETRSLSPLIAQMISQSKKCPTCKHLVEKDCPLLQTDVFLLKRLFQTFKIVLKTKIPDTVSTLPSLLGVNQKLLD